MKVYAPEFTVKFDNFPHPRKAVSYNSIREAKGAYMDFIEECDRFGQSPASVFIYIGVPDGDEDQYGYPDFPDFIMELGPKNGVVCKRAF